MFKPLTGLTVIDLSQVLAGPYATYQLALMGAEVIKIERPGMGDWTRIREGIPGADGPGLANAFVTQNANKKSVTIDLKQPDGIALLKRLVAKADVFVENFRPGTAARLGLSFEDIQAVNPKIVYCSISAYGQDGPIGHRPAYDHVVQGMCGIMRTTGTPETEPNKVGSPYVDYATGLNGAFAIVSGLHQARQTGKAVRLDVAMLDTSLMLMCSLMTNHRNTGWVPVASGNEAWSMSPSSGCFETTDGLLMIAANNERQFVSLCGAIGGEHILSDARWAGSAARRENKASLRREFEGLLAAKSADEWEAILDAAFVPAARVRGLDETLGEPQADVRRLTTKIELADGADEVHVPSLGFKVDGQAVIADRPPPYLGADTDDVLRAAGVEDSELNRLRTEGVI